MNRRNFMGKLLLAGASFAILPGAGRLWKARAVIPFDPVTYAGEWYWVDFTSDFIHIDFCSNPCLTAWILHHVAELPPASDKEARITS